MDNELGRRLWLICIIIAFNSIRGDIFHTAASDVYSLIIGNDGGSHTKLVALQNRSLCEYSVEILQVVL